MTRHPLWQLADGIQMDLRAATAKLVELRAQLAQLDIPEPAAAVCPHCGINLRYPTKLAEHVYHSHDGPLPDHWQQAEARAEP